MNSSRLIKKYKNIKIKIISNDIIETTNISREKNSLLERENLLREKNIHCDEQQKIVENQTNKKDDR